MKQSDRFDPGCLLILIVLGIFWWIVIRWIIEPHHGQSVITNPATIQDDTAQDTVASMTSHSMMDAAI